MFSSNNQTEELRNQNSIELIPGRYKLLKSSTKERKGFPIPRNDEQIVYIYKKNAGIRTNKRK